MDYIKEYTEGLHCGRPVRRVPKRGVRHRSVGAQGYAIGPRTCCLATSLKRLRYLVTALQSLEKSALGKVRC